MFTMLVWVAGSRVAGWLGRRFSHDCGSCGSRVGDVGSGDGRGTSATAWNGMGTSPLSAGSTTFVGCRESAGGGMDCEPCRVSSAAAALAVLAASPSASRRLALARCGFCMYGARFLSARTKKFTVTLSNVLIMSCATPATRPNGPSGVSGGGDRSACVYFSGIPLALRVHAKRPPSSQGRECALCQGVCVCGGSRVLCAFALRYVG